MGERTFTAVIHATGDNYTSKCPEVGTESQGETVEEALANLKHATEVYLSVFPMKEMGKPIFKTFDVKVEPPEA
jgi:predicted RNase H-like HicB family nuclease